MEEPMNITLRTSTAHIGMSRVFTLGLTLIALLSFGVSAFAQETRGTILGTVHDSSGGVIAGAEVTVTDAATNVSTKVSSNESGAFEVPYLIPGTYNVSVNAKGFKKVVRQGVVVNVGSRANIDLTLEAGVITEEVVVTAAAPLLETTSASGSAVLENRVVRSLPVFGN